MDVPRPSSVSLVIGLYFYVDFAMFKSVGSSSKIFERPCWRVVWCWHAVDPDESVLVHCRLVLRQFLPFSSKRSCLTVLIVFSYGEPWLQGLAVVSRNVNCLRFPTPPALMVSPPPILVVYLWFYFSFVLKHVSRFVSFFLLKGDSAFKWGWGFSPS